MAESREFRMMLEAKERELIALCDQQIQSLQGQVSEKENAVAELRDQISQLQDDFKYNLALLDARDAELAQYDVSSAALEASVAESEERVKAARKALADAQTLRVQEKARAEDLEYISQQKISDLEKQVGSGLSFPGLDYNPCSHRGSVIYDEIEGLQRFKEELQAKSQQEIESIKTELKDLLTEKLESEEEHKKELDKATKKWKEKVAKAEARFSESEDDLKSANRRIEATDETCKNLKKDLEAVRLSHKEDVDAASRREKEHSIKEEELSSIIDKQAKEIQALDKQLHQLRENKDANVQAGDPSGNLKEQLIELKAHHNATVDLFKGEIDSLSNKLEGAASQTRALEGEIIRIRKELEEKAQEHKELDEKHIILYSSYHDLQKKLLEKSRPLEGVLPQGLDLPEKGSGGSSSYPAASPLMSPGLSREDVIRINQGKLEAENSQLRARCEELALQNDRIRDVVGTMRMEMEALQNQTKSLSITPPSSPIKKRSGIEDVKEEVKYLKSLVQTMSNDIGDIRGRSPTVHCRRSSERRSTSLKRSGVSPIRRPKSSTKLRSHSWSRSSISPSHGVRPDSPNFSPAGETVDKVSEVDSLNASLRAQLEAVKTDMSRIIKERDLLMELSNGLRADLSRIVLSSGTGEFAHNSSFGYSTVPPSLIAQQEFESDTIPRNETLITSMSNQLDVTHPIRPRTTSPSTTRFRNNAKAQISSSKQWGFGVSHGATREKSEAMSMQMEGTSYLHERPQGVDNDPLHKGTNSQRARFKAAIKRKEELSKPKVRNWNIKDDHPLKA
ncbi:uncharacterized protein [Physcomitrium patens]|uniref:Uncharacterized protein n=1 Tax=Physcomitrium patens TaxID=3218 RepID=A0A7I4DPV0_PHYPA|nr:coiled-coil domain-containing protein 57-like [Physcomitrium patens]|eukprot:XP_024373891.1 coiled-coil domain-containing protein 57-like [Physcomitrella patens]